MTLAGPPTLSAQSRTSGRVVHLSRGDTLPVARASIVLHRVARSTQGPIDTVRADALGRFSFRFRAESAAAYLLSVRYEGIEYFSAPIGGNPALPDTGVVIVVADTSSAVPVRARERTLLISRPDESGSRTVVDWFVLQNAGERTRVARDSAAATWSTLLPPDAQNVELADTRLSQFSSEAVEFRGDSALLFAPFSPGQKELLLQYRIPGTLQRFEVPFPPGIDSVFVLLEEPAARVASPRFIAADSQRLEGRLFRRWAGVLGPAARLEIVFPTPPVSPGTILLILLGSTGAAFLALAALALRRRGAVAPPHPLHLAEVIARLDAQQLERGGELSPEERQRYQAERARLKEALTRALAAARRGS